MSADAVNRIEFPVTLDDFVDVHLRQARRSRLVQRWRRLNGLLVGVIIGLVTFIGLSLWTSASFEFRVMFTSLWAVLMSYFLFSHAIMKRRLRRLLDEQLGRDKVVCEIELRSQGAWVRQRNAEMLFEWQSAESIEDTIGGIEMRFRGGFLVARDCAFRTPAERQSFLESARKLAGRSG
jgi:hypothetical protein